MLLCLDTDLTPLCLPREAQPISLRIARFRALLRVCEKRLRALGALLASARLPPPLVMRVRQTCAAVTALSTQACQLFANGYGDALRLIDVEEARLQQEERQREAHRQSLVYIGAREPPQVYNQIGWRKRDGRRVALGRDGGQLILAAGNLGSGKSQTSTTITEGLMRAIAGITSDTWLPTAPMSFTFVPDGIRLPDILEALKENPHAQDRAFLAEHFAAQAQPIERMRMVLPQWLLPQYEQSLRPYLDLGLQLVPLRLRLPQLAISGLETLVGGDRDAAYIQSMLDKAERLGEDLNVAHWREVIEKDPYLTSRQKGLALSRLSLVNRIASEEADLWDMVEPGVYSVFVLGGRWIRESQALPLIMVLMNALTQHSARWGAFQRFFLLDEINRYDYVLEVLKHLLTTARQIRHRGSSLMLCGQDLKACLDELLALATVLMVFRLASPEILSDIQRRHGGLGGVRFSSIAEQADGEATVTVANSTDPAWRMTPEQVFFRPPLCMHGGFTKAVI